jgi:hypothetical protein
MAQYSDIMQQGINALGYYEISGSRVDGTKDRICSVPFVFVLLMHFNQKVLNSMILIVLNGSKTDLLPELQ